MSETMGADMIVTPCPVFQMNTEVYQEQINVYPVIRGNDVRQL